MTFFKLKALRLAFFNPHVCLILKKTRNLAPSNFMFMLQPQLVLITAIVFLVVIFLLGRWLYIRSIRIRNQLQTSYIFTNITHELITPLTILSASVEKVRSTSDSNQNEYDLMELNIQRCVRLLQQIPETSKSQAGELKLLVSNGDVMQYIKETARCITPLMERRHIDFSIHCKPESMMGWIDTDKLDKIIFNLLSNAAKYTGERGIVLLDVSTNRTYDHITIRVSDNGPGIPKNKQKNLFTRFYDGDYRRNQTFGTGLGLALTQELVALHRGNIYCKSIEGQGTTFIVQLPIKKDNFSPTQIDERQQGQFKIPSSQISDLHAMQNAVLMDENSTATTDKDAYRVLIVEDNQELLMLMKQLLQPKYHILTASNGVEALKVIEQNPLDIIISDVMMPEMDGYQLTSHIKQTEAYHHLPVILLTAKMQEEDRMVALSVGADDLITKPFKLRELQIRIDNMVVNRERTRSSQTVNDQAADIESENSQHISADKEFLNRAKNCVLEHLNESDYDRESFAADMGSSVSTLYNKIRSLTGMNITTYVREIRIREACRMVREDPDLRVSDVAYRVGFKDPKYFATSFKRVMGMQPKEYFGKLNENKAASKKLTP